MWTMHGQTGGEGAVHEHRHSLTFLSHDAIPLIIAVRSTHRNSYCEYHVKSLSRLGFGPSASLVLLLVESMLCIILRCS